MSVAISALDQRHDIMIAMPSVGIVQDSDGGEHPEEHPSNVMVRSTISVRITSVVPLVPGNSL